MTISIPRSPYLQVDEEQGIFRVARRALIDPDVLKDEQEAIFKKCWLYVAHESELKEPGQFVVRFAGGREVILNRDHKGKVNAFLNICPHRGARLCTERAGTTNSFLCYYHGWSFTGDGKLRVLPDREQSFPPGFNDDGSADMVGVPRLDNYRGLYFVCFDRETPSLADYLGRAKPFIDDALDQGPQGMEVVPGTQEYSVKANWKLVTENGIDGNHAATLHVTYFQYLKSIHPDFEPLADSGGSTRRPVVGSTYDLGNGHVALEYAVPWGRVAGSWSPVMGKETKDDVEQVLRDNSERLGPERAERIAKNSRNLLIFPNLHIVDGTGLTLRVTHPDTAGNSFVSSSALGACGESEKLRRLRLQSFLEFLGPGGFATPDDIEALEQCQRGYRMNAEFAPWNDVSKGRLDASEWPQEEEGNIRLFWMEWARRLSGDRSTAPLAEASM
ncbi:Rieske 2Fe-2S domain-containing protein [Streptomyces sp. NBC_00075]|uniref:aromatic ring-hydroxylating oxygenase subunit alpha n=1 Tax=Streptomyces sp. NBC_00075 TaxID=2975641 RepID=UPI003249D674